MVVGGRAGKRGAGGGHVMVVIGDGAAGLGAEPGNGNGTKFTFHYTSGTLLEHRKRSFWDPIVDQPPWLPCHQRLRSPEFPHIA